jgi:hypothetical protein
VSRRLPSLLDQHSNLLYPDAEERSRWAIRRQCPNVAFFRPATLIDKEAVTETSSRRDAGSNSYAQCRDPYSNRFRGGFSHLAIDAPKVWLAVVSAPPEKRHNRTSMVLSALARIAPSSPASSEVARIFCAGCEGTTYSVCGSGDPFLPRIQHGAAAIRSGGSPCAGPRTAIAGSMLNAGAGAGRAITNAFGSGNIPLDSRPLPGRARSPLPPLRLLHQFARRSGVAIAVGC